MALIIVGFGWVAGLVAVGAFGAPWWMGAAWAVAALPVAIWTGWFSDRRVAVAVALSAALFSGWWLDRADVREPGWLHLLGSEVEVTGTVVSEPDRGEVTTSYVVDVERVRAGDLVSSGGTVLIGFHQYEELLPGDKVVLSGELEEPPRFEGFDYRAYLAGQGIFATMFRPRVLEREPGDASFRRWLTETRLTFDESLQRALPAPEAALAGGIAFGRDDQLSDVSKEHFNRSGLRHLVAVSGTNVALVAALTYALAIPLVGRKWAWMPAAVTIVAYLCAAGLSASVFRAGIMAGVLLGGRVIGRPQSGLPALFAAVIGMTALDPRLAREPGFQLSASATAGLITLAPWLEHGLLRATAKFPRFAPPRFVCEALALTVAASVSTAPIMWVTFEQISVVSPLANVIVQPVFAVAFWLSLGTAALGLASDEWARAAGPVAYVPLAFIAWVANLGSPRWAALDLRGGSGPLAVAAYAALGAAGLFAYRFAPGPADEPPALQEARRMRRRILLFAGSGAAALAFVPLALWPRGGPGELEVSFLNVGQGDAILVTTPNGRQVLVDGGPSGSRVASELAAVLPMWDRTLDAVLLTHPQEDHVSGLVEVARRFKVGTFYATGVDNVTNSFELWASEGGGVTKLRAGDSFELDGVRFDILWPDAGYSGDSLNDSSMVLLLTYGDTTLLLTGDIEAEPLKALRERGQLDADVLKVPHHGSKTTPGWLFGVVNPAVAVISAGAGNIFGHPHPDTLQELSPYRTYRTDLDGRVIIRSDGERLRVSTER